MVKRKLGTPTPVQDDVRIQEFLDMIAPSVIKFNTDHFICGNTYRCVWVCDAATYDQGYLPSEAIAESVKIKGRGGTILQPGIDLLEKAEDFPKNGPLLLITDGYCEPLKIHRDHAFLMPKGNNLPFIPRGKVFRFS